MKIPVPSFSKPGEHHQVALRDGDWPSCTCIRYETSAPPKRCRHTEFVVRAQALAAKCVEAHGLEPGVTELLGPEQVRIEAYDRQAADALGALLRREMQPRLCLTCLVSLLALSAMKARRIEKSALSAGRATEKEQARRRKERAAARKKGRTRC